MTTEIKEFSQTEAALSELKSTCAALPSLATEEGYKQAKTTIKQVDGYRSALEKKRQELKAPVIARGRLIDSEAKRIAGELVSMIEPAKAAKKAIDEREAREKAERIARLTAKVDELKAFPEIARGKTAAEIDDLICDLGEIDTSHDFYDLTHEATVAQGEAMARLKEMRSVAANEEAQREQIKADQEQNRKERIEIDRQRKELAGLVENSSPAIPDQNSAQPVNERREIYIALRAAGVPVESAEGLTHKLTNNEIPFMFFKGAK